MYSSRKEELKVQRSLDFQSPPNSNPVSPRELGDETLIGVGLLFIIHANSGNISVHSIISDSPAQRCGCINVGDTLVSIDARPVTSNTSLTELRSRILGQRFSTVTLGFCRSTFENQSSSHSSLRFSVFLTREHSSTSSMHRKKDAFYSDHALASNFTEVNAEFQPRPPPSRLLNQSLSINGSISSTSPKQRFSVAGKKVLQDKSCIDTRELLLSRSTVTDELFQTTSNSFQRIVETISQQSNQGPSQSFSMQTSQTNDLTSKNFVYVNASDLFSIQQISIEVQAMESWIKAKVSHNFRGAICVHHPILTFRNLSRRISKC
jgi:hypothetical protein